MVGAGFVLYLVPWPLGRTVVVYAWWPRRAVGQSGVRVAVAIAVAITRATPATTPAGVALECTAEGATTWTAAESTTRWSTAAAARWPRRDIAAFRARPARRPAEAAAQACGLPVAHGASALDVHKDAAAANAHTLGARVRR